jgi:hypothetical protein
VLLEPLDGLPVSDYRGLLSPFQTSRLHRRHFAGLAPNAAARDSEDVPGFDGALSPMRTHDPRKNG